MSYFWKTVTHREDIIQREIEDVSVRVQKEHEAVLGLVDLDLKEGCVGQGRFCNRYNGNIVTKKCGTRQEDNLKMSSSNLSGTPNVVELEENIAAEETECFTDVLDMNDNTFLTDFFHDANSTREKKDHGVTEIEKDMGSGEGERKKRKNAVELNYSIQEIAALNTTEGRGITAPKKKHVRKKKSKHSSNTSEVAVTTNISIRKNGGAKRRTVSSVEEKVKKKVGKNFVAFGRFMYDEYTTNKLQHFSAKSC